MMYRVARERIVVDSVPADFGCFVPDFPSCADCTVPRFARTTYLEKRERAFLEKCHTEGFV